MKKLVAAILSAILLLSFAFLVLAAGPKDIEYKVLTKVTFSHDKHLGKGLKCADCHPKIFPKMKAKANPMTMADMKKGKACGACHTGVKNKPFPVHDCAKCHQAAETAGTKEAKKAK